MSHPSTFVLFLHYHLCYMLHPNTIAHSLLVSSLLTFHQSLKLSPYDRSRTLLFTLRPLTSISTIFYNFHESSSPLFFLASSFSFSFPFIPTFPSPFLILIEQKRKFLICTRKGRVKLSLVSRANCHKI
jgi:hypothetical protein